MGDTVENWDVFEVRLSGPSDGNPFHDVDLAAEFTIGHRTESIAGFYDGDGTYVARFMPDTQGRWTYRTRSSTAALNGHEGEFECVPSSVGNHGPVRVDRSHHFRYADGTFYSCIGTTCYGWIHQGEALARQTLESLSTSPFNKLRMTVFPKSFLYNEHDDPERFPWPLLKKGGSTWDGHWESKGGKLEWQFDFDRFDVGFFRMLDERIRQLMALGVEADIILFHPYDRWGFSQMNRDTDLFYLRYIIARTSAFRNVWWSLANEWDFMGRKTIEDFNCIGRTIAKCDPYHHLTSIHNGVKWFDQHHSWITHCSVQEHQFNIAEWRETYRKPIVIDEMGYEGDLPYVWGHLSARELVHRFWDVALGGGYPGHSEVYFTSEHIMWWNKGGTLRGESPARIAFLRRLIESGPDCGLKPHPERMTGLACGCKGDEWILGYTGRCQPIKALARLPKGRCYRLSHIDPWDMTITPTCTEIVGVDGEVFIPLIGRPHMAYLLEAVC